MQKALFGCLRVATLLPLLQLTPVSAQGVLFSESFETGAEGWTASAESGASLWHIADAGECGAPTALALAANAQCTGGTYTQISHYLESPAFFMGGPGPWTVSMDTRRAPALGSTNLDVLLVDSLDESVSIRLLGVTLPSNSVLTPIDLAVPEISGGWEGRTVFLRLQYRGGSNGDLGAPVYVDNILVSDSCATSVSYCVGSSNSVGLGASLSASGTPYVSLNNLSLSAWGLPPSQNGVVFYGDAQVQVPFGEGYRCVGGATFRLAPVWQSTAQGTIQIYPDLTAPPMNTGFGLVEPGSVWNFQLWYRDPAAGGSGFNLTNATQVTFCN
jgi:hypothetical protein